MSWKVGLGCQLCAGRPTCLSFPCQGWFKERVLGWDGGEGVLAKVTPIFTDSAKGQEKGTVSRRWQCHPADVATLSPP